MRSRKLGGGMLQFLAPQSKYDAPSIAYVILNRPISFLARLLYQTLVLARPTTSLSVEPIRVVCISDTHSNQQPSDIPDGDLLIHSGDVTDDGDIPSLQAQIDWIASLPHTHKVVIAGNHDTYFDPEARKHLKPEHNVGELDWRGVHYLQHSQVTLRFSKRGNRKLKVYGAPQTRRLGRRVPHYAFQYDDERDAWTDTVPDDVDVLVTHSPPRWHLDLPDGLGCPFLLKECWRVQPRLHVFGHIHDGSGIEEVYWDRSQAALERLLERDTRGTVRALISARNWIDIFKIVYYGLKTVLWMRLWGGDMYATTCVNAAWMNRQLYPTAGNPARLIEI